MYGFIDPRQVQLSMATQRKKDLEVELETLDRTEVSKVTGESSHLTHYPGPL